jgi:hypothetical protein
MAKSIQKVPYKIADYIKEHFKEDFLFEVKEVREINGKLHYLIEVAKNNFIHTLLFNEAGELVQEEANQAFPSDRYEAPGSADIPD